MARKKLRRIRFQSKRMRRRKADPVRNKTDSTPSAPSAPQSTTLTSQDIASKLIPLSLPSAKDAQKNAEKAIENVFAAVRHALSEGDLSIADFGDLKAAKDGKGGDIRIRFIPDEKLRLAAEARLNPAVTPNSGEIRKAPKRYIRHRQAGAGSAPQGR